MYLFSFRCLSVSFKASFKCDKLLTGGEGEKHTLLILQIFFSAVYSVSNRSR